MTAALLLKLSLIAIFVFGLIAVGTSGYRQNAPGITRGAHHFALACCIVAAGVYCVVLSIS